jgi:hypothetical protein
MATAQDQATGQLGALPFGTIIGGPLVAAVEAQAAAARSTVEFIDAVGFAAPVGPVTSIVVDDGGSGYGTSAPAVTIGDAPGGGATAAATAVLDKGGAVTSVTIVTAGSGYTTAPTVTIGDAPSGGTTATATASIARPLQYVRFSYTSGDESRELLVPLLTIVPIPYIRIDDMTVQFKANISAESATDSTRTSTESRAAELGVTGKYGWGPASVQASFNASYSSKKDSTSAATSKYSVEYTMDVYVHVVQDDLPKGMQTVLGLLSDGIGA